MEVFYLVVLISSVVGYSIALVTVEVYTLLHNLIDRLHRAGKPPCDLNYLRPAILTTEFKVRELHHKGKEFKYE